jgi:hypothetical protein
MPTQEKKSVAGEAVGHVRAIAEEVEALRGEVQGTKHEIQDFLERSVKEHPYRSVLLAFGAGYVLAGGLASRLTREVIRVGLRSAAPSLLAAALTRMESTGEESVPGGRASKSQSPPSHEP